jgi:GNAT superfamily N-acetyltransferase
VTDLPDATTTVLRDGRQVILRPLVEADRLEHRLFVEHLSRRSSRFRFFVPLRTLNTRQQDRYFDLDFQDRAALVACFPGEATVRGVARYARESETTAEVAFVVEDALQGKGVGTAMLRRLAVLARRAGISKFSAWVLSENSQMISLFRRSGWPMVIHYQGDTARVELDLPEEP